MLPFENLSADKDNEYFASGMQDMILTRLADIRELKVISRTSTEKYKSHPDNLKTIARELGVAKIVKGSVQKAGNQVLTHNSSVPFLIVPFTAPSASCQEERAMMLTQTA